MGLLGARITKANFEIHKVYRVFVQSKGSGARLLEASTHVLYVQVEQVHVVNMDYNSIGCRGGYSS